MSRNRKVVAIIVSVLIISGLGAYWLLASGSVATTSTHLIAIDKVAIDLVDAPTGSVDYVILTNESNSGKETWHVNSTSFEVVSNRSSVYMTSGTNSPSGSNGPTAIPAGQRRMIELLFQLPIGQSPVQLIYNDQTIGTKTAIAVPTASGWLSKFNFISDVTKTGSGNYVIGIIAYAIVLNTTYPSFPGGDRIQYTFLTGDRFTVGIQLQYYKQPADPASIMVTSVANSDGFTVVSVKPSLPVTMTGWGSKATIAVTLLAPNESYSGGLHFVVGFQSSTP